MSVAGTGPPISRITEPLAPAAVSPPLSLTVIAGWSGGGDQRHVAIAEKRELGQGERSRAVESDVERAPIGDGHRAALPLPPNVVAGATEIALAGASEPLR